MNIKKNVWNGLDDISNKILLVYSDGSIADTIKYCCFLKNLQNKTKKIIFVTQKDIIKFLKQNSFGFEIYPLEIELNSLKYDYFVNLSDLKNMKTDFFIKNMEVEHQDLRLFRALHIFDHRRFNVGIMFSPDISAESFKIFTKIQDISVYSFSECKDNIFGSLIEWNKYITNIYELALAIKSMHIIISNDETTINLAGVLGKPVFALYEEKDSVNKYYKNITPFIKRTKDDSWNILLAQAKMELENYRIQLREKYLNGCLDQVEKGLNATKETIMDTKASIIARLYFETHNTKYLQDYIDLQYEYAKISKDNKICLGNIATFLSFHTGKKDEARKIWNDILPFFTPENNPDLIFNYGCFQCLEGNFSEFLKDYEYRFKKHKNPTTYPKFDKPRWNGEKDVTDKTLLVYFEQGYGDEFLFCRYLSDVEKMFKKVIYVSHENSAELIKKSFPKVEVYTEKTFNTRNIKSDYKIHVITCNSKNNPDGLIEKIISNKEDNLKNTFYDTDFDYHVPVMSLAYCLNANPDKYTKKKWLKADNKKVKIFKKYFSDEKFNIGIFWESTKSNIQRGIDLNTMLPLGHIDKVQLYSLQVDKEDFEINYLDENINIINLGKYFKDFSDTAAAITNCDLIVATDSSVLNLAGALGKQTFGLFNQFPEWRWYKLEGKNVGWYKAVKPFQAKIQNDYTNVIEQICAEIRELIKNNDRFN